MIDWKIRSRSTECEACKVKFDDEQVYHTLLFAERKEHQRVDVCRECWDEQYGQGASDRKGFISHWSGTFHVPPPPPPEPLQKDTADTALAKLVELGNQEYEPICFILSAMLERKRLLKVREEFRDEGKRGFVYENPKTGDIFTIRDPELKLDELQDVQRDVAFLLEEGVEAFLRGDVDSEDSENDSKGESVRDEVEVDDDEVDDDEVDDDEVDDDEVDDDEVDDDASAVIESIKA